MLFSALFNALLYFDLNVYSTLRSFKKTWSIATRQLALQICVLFYALFLSSVCKSHMPASIRLLQTLITNHYYAQ